MRKLLTPLIIALLIALGVDLATKSAAENMIGSELQSHFRLDSKPGVSLEGFPFLLSVARGRLPRVILEVGPIEREGARLDGARVELKGLRFSSSEILSGDLGSVSARSGNGSASLGQETINRALERQNVPLRVRLTGRVLVEHPTLEEPVEGRASIDDGRLVLSGPAPLEPVAIALPEVGTGILFRDVRIEGSSAVLGLTLTERALHFGD